MPDMRSTYLAALLISVLSSGCGVGIDVPDPGCADCGECGIAGPTQDPGKDIFVLGPGVTTGGLAAVDLALEEGVCIASDRRLFRLTYDAGKVTVSSADGLAKLDAAATTSDANNTFTWKDRTLQASFEATGTTVSFTFTGMGTSTKVACDGAQEVITCAPE
jgi:hypothetical protein